MAGRFLASGVALALLCIALIIHDLSGANRPHELKLVPLVSALSLLNVVLCVATLTRLAAAWRTRAAHPLRGYHYLLFALAVAYGFVSAFLLVASVGTWIG